MDDDGSESLVISTMALLPGPLTEVQPWRREELFRDGEIELSSSWRRQRKAQARDSQHLMWRQLVTYNVVGSGIFIFPCFYIIHFSLTSLVT
jgi:hypothetical protein